MVAGKHVAADEAVQAVEGPQVLGVAPFVALQELDGVGRDVLQERVAAEEVVVGREEHRGAGRVAWRDVGGGVRVAEHEPLPIRQFAADGDVLHPRVHVLGAVLRRRDGLRRGPVAGQGLRERGGAAGGIVTERLQEGGLHPRRMELDAMLAVQGRGVAGVVDVAVRHEEAEGGGFDAGRIQAPQEGIAAGSRADATVHEGRAASREEPRIGALERQGQRDDDADGGRQRAGQSPRP